MTTVYVDLVNLDGSRPEGTLRFILERMVLGDPDVVPSSVEARIRDGRARVEGLLPGDMRVRVSAGDWSKTWRIKVPAEGEHDLFKLLGEQAPEFEHALWATLLGRVEALESAPAVDLAPLEERVTALESRPAPEPFDPSALQAQLAELQAHLTPVGLSYDDGIADDLGPLWESGSIVSITQHAGRVNLKIKANDPERLIRVLDGLELPHFPEPKYAYYAETFPCDVWLFQGAKSLTKLDPYLIALGEMGGIALGKRDGVLRFLMKADDVLAVVREVGADKIVLSTSYSTEVPPPPELLS